MIKNCETCRHEISSICLECDKKTYRGWEPKKELSDKGIIIEKLKDLSIMLAQSYTGNIQIQLDVNRTNRIAKIRITENIQ